MGFIAWTFCYFAVAAVANSETPSEDPRVVGHHQPYASFFTANLFNATVLLSLQYRAAGDPFNSRNSTLEACELNQDCTQPPNIAWAPKNPNLVQGVVCENQVCSCPENYCLSRGYRSVDYSYFQYCGPCGRVGSQCNNTSQCATPGEECYDGWCACPGGGQPFDLYYCVYYYRGYEKALQVALVACVTVAVCLLVVSLYSVCRGNRDGVNPALLRLMRRQNNARSQPPPGDIPPRYDTLVDPESPPSYEDALQQMGRDNLSYEPSNAGSNAGSSAGSHNGSNAGSHTGSSFGSLEDPERRRRRSYGGAASVEEIRRWRRASLPAPSDALGAATSVITRYISPTRIDCSSNPGSLHSGSVVSQSRTKL